MPLPGAVKYYFHLWRDDGIDQDIHGLPHRQMRDERKRLADPSLVVLDTQSLPASAGVPAAMTGRDAAKKGPGRTRCLAVDVSGLVIDCVVLPASAHDNAAGIALLDGVAGQCDTVEKALVDQGFKKKVVDTLSGRAGAPVGGHLCALVPGESADQVFGQRPDGIHQGVPDVFGAAAVGQVQEHHAAGGAFDEGADRRSAVLADDQVALPVAGDGPVFGLGGTFADHAQGARRRGCRLRVCRWGLRRVRPERSARAGSRRSSPRPWT